MVKTISLDGPRPAHGTDRLEARVSSELKRLFKRAADLQGVTLSDFVVASLRQAALQVLEQHELIRLTEQDARLFARTLLKPPAPNARLRAAARRYRRVRAAHEG